MASYPLAISRLGTVRLSVETMNTLHLSLHFQHLKRGLDE